MNPTPTIQELYPALSPDECREVEETWKLYLALVAEVYDRIIADDRLYAEFRALTVTNPSATMPEAAGLAQASGTAIPSSRRP